MTQENPAPAKKAAAKKAAAKKAIATVDARSDAEREADRKQARLDAITAARTKALSELRENHRDELNQRIAELVKEAGYNWKPAPTEAEKAEAKIKELLAANPGIDVRALHYGTLGDGDESQG